MSSNSRSVCLHSFHRCQPKICVCSRNLTDPSWVSTKCKLSLLTFSEETFCHAVGQRNLDFLLTLSLSLPSVPRLGLVFLRFIRRASIFAVWRIFRASKSNLFTLRINFDHRSASDTNRHLNVLVSREQDLFSVSFQISIKFLSSHISFKSRGIKLKDLKSKIFFNKRLNSVAVAFFISKESYP